MNAERTDQNTLSRYFAADPWRKRIFFLGAFWWMPFLMIGGYYHAIYGPIEPWPPSIWLDAALFVEWIVKTATFPIWIVLFAWLFIAQINRRQGSIVSRTLIGTDSFKNVFGTLGIIGFFFTFFVYWGIVFLLIYESLRSMWRRMTG